MTNKPFIITEGKIKQYKLYLREEERADNTVEKYARDIRAFALFLGGEAATKEGAVGWKESLKETHSAASINSMTAALNGFFGFYGLGIKVKPLKIQKKSFLAAGEELTKEEYEQLLRAAKTAENDRLYHIMQTICATGIRVSELRFITAEAVLAGRAEVTNKGKTRVVLIPCDLRAGLLEYFRRGGIQSGPVFVTKGGKAVDRSNIWAAMKRLCDMAGVDAKKVYPHSLRALFSRMVHGVDKDIAILAEILGHSDINTTRVYVRENAAKYRTIVDNLGLARMRYTT